MAMNVYDVAVATHIRKNITLPADLDQRLRRLADERGTSQSGLIAQLVSEALAIEDADGDPLLRYIGSIAGPADMSATVDEVVYRS
jgi:catechol-2,3-dioxygenase